MTRAFALRGRRSRLLGDRVRDVAQRPGSVPGRRTASFSAAISCSVSPSHCVWSRPIEVRTVTFDSRTFVASRRPPSPASITPTSTLGVAKRHERGSRRRLELRHALFLFEALLDAGHHGRDGANRASRTPRPSISAPPDPHPLRPALRVRREVGAGGPPRGLEQRRRHLRHRRLAVGADHVDRFELELGSPRAARSALIRSSPKRHPIGSSDASQSSAVTRVSSASSAR